MTTVEAAWREYQSKLFSFVRSKVATSEDAEDIINNVFVSLLKKTTLNETPDNIASWLYRVTKNSIVDYYRAKKQFEVLPEELASDSAETNIMEQLSNCMLPMINALPETYQLPLLLSEIEGKKHSEIASSLSLSLTAVKSRILRGREKLLKSLVACCTFHLDSADKIFDYEPNVNNSCGDCDN